MHPTHTRAPALAALITALAASSAPARDTTPLDAGWMFTTTDPADPTDPTDPAAPSAAWTPVKLPHTWNAADGQDGSTNGNAPYRRGPGWYTLRLPHLPAPGEARAFLRFGAANSRADVSLDGLPLGSHIGGHTAFCLEIPLAGLPAGGARTLTVRVDNTHDPNIAPFDADFTFFGGLYRPAQIIVAPNACIDPTHLGSQGLWVEQRALTDLQADLTARVVASAATPQRARLITRVRTAAGRVVSTRQSDHDLTREPQTLAHDHTLVSPRRWDGPADPYLYTLEAELIAGGIVAPAGAPPGTPDPASPATAIETRDAASVTFGVRTIEVDPQRGFLLNGRPYPLRGVNKHQDLLNKGWAISHADIAHDMALIERMGANAVRFAHYPHDPAAYAECDRRGLIAYAEIPLVNRVTPGGAFAENTQQMLREMIAQLRNHPSIALWGLQNEVTAPWVKDRGEDPEALVRALHALARDMDPSRPTTSAGTVPREHPSNWVADVPGVNAYYGWYDGTPEGLAPFLDRLHAQYPDKPLGLTEYGAGANILHHTDTPTKPQHDGAFHPETWQRHLHEVSYAAIAERPWLWGTFVWNMFDFAADQRLEGDTPGRNDKGLVTYDRATPKDAYYFYQANWSAEPMVYVADRRHTRRTEPLTTVTVYCNGASVTLSRNGEAIGTQPVGPLGIARFEGVRLSPGENVLRATAEFEGAARLGGPRSDEVRWQLAAD